MKLWNLDVPLGSMYAQLQSIYTPPEEIHCETCNRSKNSELVVEWEDGSDLIGDFIACGARIVAKKKIVDDITKNFKGVFKRKIHYFDHPQLYKKKSKKIRKRIWLPYEGPELCEIDVVKEVDLHESSTVVIDEICSKCGGIIYGGINGVEINDSSHSIPRISGKGLFVDADELDGYDIFKIKYTWIILCTDNFKTFVESNCYTNVQFLEYGEII